MNDIIILHPPVWIRDGEDWHLMIGNRSVAKVIPNSCDMFPEYKWLSLLDPEFSDQSWHAVDFVNLDSARNDITQWWLHLCRGQEYNPAFDEFDE